MTKKNEVISWSDGPEDGVKVSVEVNFNNMMMTVKTVQIDYRGICESVEICLLTRNDSQWHSQTYNYKCLNIGESDFEQEITNCVNVWRNAQNIDSLTQKWHIERLQRMIERHKIEDQAFVHKLETHYQIFLNS